MKEQNEALVEKLRKSEEKAQMAKNDVNKYRNIFIIRDF
jgi:hypothetical protein